MQELRTRLAPRVTVQFALRENTRPLLVLLRARNAVQITIHQLAQPLVLRALPTQVHQRAPPLLLRVFVFRASLEFLVEVHVLALWCVKTAVLAAISKFSVFVPVISSLWAGETVQLTVSLSSPAATQLFINVSTSLSSVVVSPRTLVFGAVQNASSFSLSVLPAATVVSTVMSFALFGVDAVNYQTPTSTPFTVYPQVKFSVLAPAAALLGDVFSVSINSSGPVAADVLIQLNSSCFVLSPSTLTFRAGSTAAGSSQTLVLTVPWRSALGQCAIMSSVTCALPSTLASLPPISFLLQPPSFSVQGSSTVPLFHGQPATSVTLTLKCPTPAPAFNISITAPLGVSVLPSQLVVLPGLQTAGADELSFSLSASTAAAIGSSTLAFQLVTGPAVVFPTITLSIVANFGELRTLLS